MRGIFLFCRKSGLFFIGMVFAITVCIAVTAVMAANIEVSSRLSDEETMVGEPVQLEIIVQGARNAQVPRDWEVEGLQSRYAGESVQIQMVNFQVSTSSLYTFIILPLRSGSFTIPELEIKVEGKVFRTKPLRLQVNARSSSGSGGGSSRGGQSAILPPVLSSPGNNPADAQTGRQLAFGTLVLPKKQLYVGEVIPVEICYYFHPDLPVQSINSIPSLIGDDFVVQKISPEPQQGEQEVKGVKYATLSFRTSLRALKAGKLQLPATSIICQVVTQARPDIPEGLMPNAFFQSFLASMPGIAHVQKLEIKSEPVTIKVIPLPEENRPDSFHGAIGNFSLSTDILTQELSPGDPVTLRAIVSGEGNFGQMSAPTLVSPQGWQTYPPTAKFIGSNSIDYSGKKMFDWMLVPKESKTATPAVKFSYFNPNSGKYVTLQGDSHPIHAMPAAATSNVTLAPAPLVTPSTVAAPTAQQEEKFKIAKNVRSETFQPITARREFIFANAAALLVLLAFLGIQFARYYAASGRGSQAALRRSLAAHRARAATCEGKDFYSTVVKFLRLRVSSSNQDMKIYSGAEVVSTLGLEGEEAKLVLEIFSRYEELTYGAQEWQRPLSVETRTAILHLLDRLSVNKKVVGCLLSIVC